MKREILSQKSAKPGETDTSAPDIALLFASIEKISNRLEKLERASTDERQTFANPSLPHPSLDKFNVAEAIADTIFDGRYKEKACTFEPSKPCDHCSMCNSRGF